MGETKKEVAKPAPKRSTVTKKVSSAKKATKPAHTILEIADHATIKQVSEKITNSVKQSEHWHALLFAIIVILAAYFSYSATATRVAVVTPQTNTDDQQATIAPVKTDDVVYSFNFPSDYAWTTQKVSDDLTLAPGETGHFTIQIRNTGSATWYRDAVNAFRMGTLQPTDALIPFMAGSVLDTGKINDAPNRNRIELEQAKVAPGEAATFDMQVKASDWAGKALAPGRYTVTVGFMVEGKGSLSKQPLTWVLNVK